MNTRLYPVILGLCSLGISIGQAQADERLPTVDEVRDQLKLGCGNYNFIDQSSTNSLDKYGNKLFPIYEIIIADPKSSYIEVALAFYQILYTKGDNLRFVPLAVKRLTDKSDSIVKAALELLAEIGSERDTAPIIALLVHEDSGVRKQAARALGKIGGERDIVAIDICLKNDIWIKLGHLSADTRYQRELKDARDAIEKRLKEAEKKEKEKK